MDWVSSVIAPGGVGSTKVMGFLDKRIFAFDHEDGRALCHVLPMLYGRTSLIESLCRRAGLPLELIVLSGSARDIWESVLSEAAKTAVLRELSQVILEDPLSVEARPLLDRLLEEPREEPADSPQASVSQPTAGLQAVPAPQEDRTSDEAVDPPRLIGSGPKVIRTLKGHRSWITSVRFSQDGTRLASADESGQVLLWDLTDDQSGAQSVSEHLGVVYSVAFNADGSLLATAGADHSVRIRNLALPQMNRVLTEHTKAVLSVAFNHDGSQLASGSADCTVRLYDVSASSTLSKLIGRHGDEVGDVQFNRAGSLLASAGADRAVRLWKFPGGALQHTLNGHTGRVGAIAFSPNDVKLVSADWVKHSLTVWNLETGREDVSIPGGPCRCGQEDWLPDLAFSPSGVLASAGYCDGSIRLWDIATRTMVAQLTEHSGPVSALAYSNDGKLLASGGGLDHDVRIWSDMSRAVGQRDV